MISRALRCGVLFACLMAGVSVQAHHATASVYDPQKFGDVHGKLAAIKFVNPHGLIQVTVTNEDGTTTEWTFTTGSTTALANQGISQVGPNALKIGEELDVHFRPARNGAPLGGLLTITRANGQVLGQGEDF